MWMNIWRGRGADEEDTKGVSDASDASAVGKARGTHLEASAEIGRLYVSAHERFRKAQIGAYEHAYPKGIVLYVHARSDRRFFPKGRRFDSG